MIKQLKFPTILCKEKNLWFLLAAPKMPKCEKLQKYEKYDNLILSILYQYGAYFGAYLNARAAYFHL